MSTFYDSKNDYRNYIAHYGIKGMRWHKHVARTKNTQGMTNLGSEWDRYQNYMNHPDLYAQATDPNRSTVRRQRTREELADMQRERTERIRGSASRNMASKSSQSPFRPRNHDREDATNRSNAPKNPKRHDPQLSEQEIASRRQHDQMRSRLESRQRDMERHSAQNRRASDEGRVLSDKKKLEEARQNQRKKRPGRNVPHTAHKPSSRPRSSRS